MEIAYSYIRFSTAAQREGHSLDRQIAATHQWCERNGVQLDKSLNLRDLGVSAFTDKHRDDKHALGQFLKLIERGRIPKGSYLVIENLDRLSRQEERAALRLWMDILDAGVNIVQLFPEKIFRHEQSDMTDIIHAIIELSRGHSESVAKSERLGAAWAAKKKAAREKKSPLTVRVPDWLRVENGKIKTRPERVAVVRRIFQLAKSGYAGYGIARLLVKEEIPYWGRAGRWSRQIVTHILNSRAVLGEYQPTLTRHGERRADGEPIPGFYPRIIDDETWSLTRADVAMRQRFRGCNGMLVNVFAGLLYDALLGGKYYACKYSHSKRYFLINTEAAAGRSKLNTFPLGVFEEALLGELSLIEPGELEPLSGTAQRVAVLAAERAETEQKIRKLEDDLESHGTSESLSRVVRRLETRLAELERLIAEARTASESTLAEDWSQARGLLSHLKADADRLHLRSVLRRALHGIWIAIVGIPDISDRYCIAQAFFRDSPKSYAYIIHYRPGSGFRPKYQAQTGRIGAAETGFAFDLRDKKSALRAATWAAQTRPQLLDPIPRRRRRRKNHE